MSNKGPGVAHSAPGGLRLPLRFRDRRQAGWYLGKAVADLAGRDDLLVLAIPRGGVPVAHEVALALRAPLDVIVVRKLGHPAQPELAMGAVASGGVRILNAEVAAGLSQRTIEHVTQRERAELERRERAYRGDRPPADPAGRTVMVVDDGLATGSSMRAALAALRQRGPAGIIVAVPVGPASTCAEIGAEVDRMVCLMQPDLFLAVGEWYEDFSTTSDQEVRDLLAGSAQIGRASGGGQGDAGG